MIGELRAFYAHRRVLVTGHTGFKGAWLCHWLSRLGAHVVGYSLPALGGTVFDRARPDLLAHHEGDIGDRAKLAATLRMHEPEIIFHLAGQALVKRAAEDPLETLTTNAMGTATLLDAARSLSPQSLRAIVIATSDKVYRNDGPSAPFSESAPLGADEPYGASKASAEHIVSAMRRTYFGGGLLATARAGNVIGGGDIAHDRLIPDALRAYRTGAPLRLRHPESTRPWAYVLDVLSGYLRLAKALSTGDPGFAEAWNFGPPSDAPILTARELLALLEGALGVPIPRAPADGSFGFEAPTLALSTEKARVRLGHAARTSMKEAVSRVATFERAGADARDTVLAELASYEASLIAEAAPGKSS